MTVGQRLREVRGRFTLKEFAEPLEVTPTQISTIENDKSGLSVELAVRISKAYKVSLDWLLMGEEVTFKTEDPPGDYVTISKDELIALQRQALKTKDEELVQKQEQIGKLQKQVQQVKNIEGAAY